MSEENKSCSAAMAEGLFVNARDLHDATVLLRKLKERVQP